MIKAIVFDFGDVFINLDKEATVKMITQKFGSFMFNDEINAINSQYETGAITTKEFTQFYKNYFNTEDEQFLQTAWNAIILDFPESRLEFISKLAKLKTHKLFLLSNTNALHIEKVKEQMTLKRYSKFKSCFDNFYLSHEIQLRKPDATIFKYVCEQNKLLPQECLFIDDTLEHIQTAELLGFKTWNLDPKVEDVSQLIELKQELFL